MQKREFLAQFQKAGGRSRCASRVPDAASGRSNCASRVPGADNGTEILSPANEQYKGRKSLAAVLEAPRRVPLAGGRSK